MAPHSSPLARRSDGTFVVAGAPSIAGLTFRSYRDENDLAAMAEVFNRASYANGESATRSVSTLRNEIENPARLDARAETVLAFVGDELVAMAELDWADTTDGERLYRSLGAVHPMWRRRGLGRAMLARNEARFAEIASGHTLARPAKVMTWLADLDLGGVALFRSRGYARVRTFHHMVRPSLERIDVAPLPDGLEVRPIRPEQLRQLWDAMVEAFRDHFGGHDGSTGSFLRWSRDPELDLDLAVVAFEGSEIAGGVIGYIDTHENEALGYQRGWADPVFTRRPWRRRGLAGALMGRALVALRQRGMTSAQLEVDTQNPNAALRLYRRQGFVADRSTSEWHRLLETSTGTIGDIDSLDEEASGRFA